MSGGSARSIRNFSLELWQELVWHGTGKTTFQHLMVNWNFNVLEIASKESILSRGSPGHLDYLFLDIPPTYFPKGPWRPILVFVGRSRGLPENPKSMGWEIDGVGNPWVGNSWKINEQIQDFWKPIFRQKVKVLKQVGVFSQSF